MLSCVAHGQDCQHAWGPCGKPPSTRYFWTGGERWHVGGPTRRPHRCRCHDQRGARRSERIASAKYRSVLRNGPANQHRGKGASWARRLRQTASMRSGQPRSRPERPAGIGTQGTHATPVRPVQRAQARLTVGRAGRSAGAGGGRRRRTGDRPPRERPHRGAGADGSRVEDTSRRSRRSRAAGAGGCIQDPQGRPARRGRGVDRSRGRRRRSCDRAPPHVGPRHRHRLARRHPSTDGGRLRGELLGRAGARGRSGCPAQP